MSRPALSLTLTQRLPLQAGHVSLRTISTISLGGFTLLLRVASPQLATRVPRLLNNAYMMCMDWLPAFLTGVPATESMQRRAGRRTALLDRKLRSARELDDVLNV